MNILSLSKEQMDKDLGYSQAIADAKAVVRNIGFPLSKVVTDMLLLKLEELAYQYREELQNENEVTA